MSNSPEQDDAKCFLVADGRDRYVEIRVFNSRLDPQTLDHNLGRIDVALLRGVYSVRFQVGNASEERLAVLDGAEAQTVTLEKPLSFRALAPLPDTKDHDAVLAQGVVTLSEIKEPLGEREGSLQIVLYSFGRGECAGLARGLQLFDAAGQLLLDLEKECPADENRRWAGCHLRLPAGIYRLRQKVREFGYLERVVWVCSNWRSLLFLASPPIDSESKSMPDQSAAQDGVSPIDFRLSSLLMAPANAALDLASDQLRWGELALQALERGTARPPAFSKLDELGDNPLLLLLEGRLQLQRRKSQPEDGKEDQLDVQPEYLRELFGKLARQAGFAADVRALGHEFLLGLGSDPVIEEQLRALPPISTPPLLFSSWQALIRAAVQEPGVIQREGLPDALAGQFKPVGSWLVWWSGGLPAAPVSESQREPLSPESLKETLKAIESLLGSLFDLLPRCPQWLELMDRQLLWPIDSVAAESVWPHCRPEWQRLLEKRPRLRERLPQVERLGVSEFLETMLLPPERGLEVAQRLLNELRTFVLGVSLRELVESGAVVPALRRAHLPCRRLLSFEDFCQEVSLRALQHAHTFQSRTDDRSSLIGWLQAIGRQLAMNYLRRSVRRECYPLPEAVVDAGAPSAGTVEDEEEAQKRMADLARLIGWLRPEEQNLLFRLHFRGERLVDIARGLGVPQNTLNKRYERLITRLRNQLSSQH